jgi:hypothetical protein
MQSDWNNIAWRWIGIMISLPTVLASLYFATDIQADWPWRAICLLLARIAAIPAWWIIWACEPKRGWNKYK